MTRVELVGIVALGTLIGAVLGGLMIHVGSAPRVDSKVDSAAKDPQRAPQAAAIARSHNPDPDTARWNVAGFREPEKFLVWLRRFQDFVAADDRDAVVAAVEFPVHSVETEEELRARYDVFFSDEVRRAVAEIDEDRIFRNYQGAMIHHGTLWFRETDEGFRVVAINPDAATYR